MDAFFAAVEERDKPRLKGLPIVVGADPKGGFGRGVVSTANYKAREYGIRSAMPISQAWRLSEAAAREGKTRAVFLEPNFRSYSAASKAIMEYLRSKAEVVEPASIDEAYLEIFSFAIHHPERERRILRDSSSDRGRTQNDAWKKAEEIAQEIKDYIKKSQQLTCSVGIGPNKLVAKIASGMQKPDGLTIVKPEQVQDFLDPLSVKEIPGIGPKSQEILNRLGIKTIKDLRELPEEKLKELFGKWGSDMHRKAQGIDESPVVAEYETKSIGEQETYERDTLESNFLVERIKELSRGVFSRVQNEGFSSPSPNTPGVNPEMKARRTLRSSKSEGRVALENSARYPECKLGKLHFRTVAIIVRFHDFETKTRSHTLAAPVKDLKILETEALQLFLPFLDSRENPKRKLIRLLGVRVEKLENKISNS